MFILTFIQGGANPKPVCQTSDRRSVGSHLGHSGFSLYNRAFEGIEKAIRDNDPGGGSFRTILPGSTPESKGANGLDESAPESSVPGLCGTRLRS